MPTAKHHHDRLSPALLYYLVYGDLPPRDHRGGRTGLVEAFQLKHSSRRPPVLSCCAPSGPCTPMKFAPPRPGARTPGSSKRSGRPTKADEQEDLGRKTHK
jgi:hypothetical protein